MLKHPLAIVVPLGLLGHFALVAGQSGGEDQTSQNALVAGDSTTGRPSSNEETSPQASAEARKLYKMGVKYGRARLFRQAAESFQKAVELKPDFSDAHHGLGHAYFDLGRWQESIQSLERALQLNPKDVDAYSMLGEAYMMLRRETNTTSPPVIAPVQQKHAAGVPVALKSENAKGTNSINSTSSDEDLTRIYRVGAGDVLDIRFAHSSDTRSTLFTVTPGGLLEHPTLTEPLPVAGLTVDEITTRLEEDLRRRAINENPTISVGVRDYQSHTILVSGLVKEPGTKILRREAIPLYVVIADAQPMAEAGRATLVSRDTKDVLDIELTDSQKMDRLVRPGDVITLHPPLTQYFYVGGEVKSAGEKPFRRGLTLTQAILAAGGLTRDAREAQLARDSGNGFLAVTRFKLKDLNSGKLQDPPIQPGDRITVVH